MKKFYMTIVAIILAISCVLAGCEAEKNGSTKDVASTKKTAATLQENQPTPTDIDYSLERYNLIRRAYWVNGQREKANALPCEIEKPLGYIVLFTESGSVVGKFVVDGKVSSLNSFLTPDSEYYERDLGNEGVYHNSWLADVDGSYGENDNGIFFFDVAGNYIEWTGTYLYTDIPMEITEPIVNFEVNYTEVE
jgi:hypothetical protein